MQILFKNASMGDELNNPCTSFNTDNLFGWSSAWNSFLAISTYLHDEEVCCSRGDEYWLPTRLELGFPWLRTHIYDPRLGNHWEVVILLETSSPTNNEKSPKKFMYWSTKFWNNPQDVSLQWMRGGFWSNTRKFWTHVHSSFSWLTPETKRWNLRSAQCSRIDQEPKEHFIC